MPATGELPDGVAQTFLTSAERPGGSAQPAAPPGPRPVIELRVHGVHGTSPATMLDDPFPVPVDGDDVAQFLRCRPGNAGPAAGRTIEAFHWGRFTAGSPSRALWLLMAPFAVLNLARYALLLPTGPGARRTLPARLADGVLRLLGLALTVLLVITTAFVTLNVLAHQCGSYPGCVRQAAWLAFAVDWPLGGRLLLGSVPPLSVIALLWWFGRQNFLFEPRGGRPDLTRRNRNGGLGDRAFWYSSPQAAPLRALHVGAACATLGLLLAGIGRLGAEPAGLRSPLVLLGAALGAAAVLLTVLVPSLERTDRGDQAKLDTCKVDRLVLLTKWVSVGYLVVALGVASVRNWEPFAAGDAAVPLPGFEGAAELGTILLAGLLLALQPPCWLLRRAYRRTPEFGRTPADYRPVWGGFGTVLLTALALLLAGGMSSGVAFWSAELVGEPVVRGAARPPGGATEWGIVLGPSYWTGAALWGCAAALLVLAAPALLSHVFGLPARVSLALLVAGLALPVSALALARELPLLGFPVLGGGLVGLVAGSFWWYRCWAEEGLGREVRAFYGIDAERASGDPGWIAPRGLSKIALAWRLGRLQDRAQWPLGTLAGLGIGYLLAGMALAVRRTPMPALAAVGVPSVPDTAVEFLSVFGTLGATVVTALAVTMVVLGWRSWGNQKVRTGVGVLWDLLSFWPRLAHPICPPPYGGRAVLELVERIRFLTGHAQKQPDVGPGVVVLSGHSQGSLVCAAAAAVVAENERALLPDMCLLTYGSPLRWAYARLFPAYVGFPLLQRLYEVDLETRWRNLYRETDPIGGRVLTWPEAEAARDLCLRDPLRVDREPDTPLTPLWGHRNYYRDPAFDTAVGALAETVPSR